ncbi:MAG: A/G-specific adenine glycosylase [Candidatus Taylorbacteria bacterium]|nr:A/G-specific adenine glycosylase [Candidatus Taylorbacteria bacterium]
MKHLGAKQIQSFQKEIYKAYKNNKRPHLPWRHTFDPYHILVSEVMLQQTQVERVVPKYVAFIRKFPTIQKLARASTSDLLHMWQGLGYNRRALFLQKAAIDIYQKYKGVFPRDFNTLLTLKGVGQSTAGAILNFAYNIPHAFIETNIRTIYIHHFFKNSSHVDDIHILSLVRDTIDIKNPREWFYALYDYGTELKAKLGKRKTKVHQKSKSYTKQSKFKGSNREIRGAILKTLVESKEVYLTIEDMAKKSNVIQNAGVSKVHNILVSLESEGFIKKGKKPGQFGIL